jgi:CHAT domain-containing protein
MRPGDVLLSYAGAELTSVEQLGKLIADHAQDKSVAVRVWREGEASVAVRDVAPGKLGVVVAKEPAPAALAERRKTDRMLASLRGGDWKELPGTRVELARLATLFGGRATLLAGSEASEQRLEGLRAAGRLQGFRYLHFATHGQANDEKAFESALILAQDDLPKDPAAAAAGATDAKAQFIDGRLTAAEVLEGWTLDAELVTLSACESGLGRKGGGDGLLGFAQAFLHAGSRAVCLSLWKVDDAATALLMDRFYHNLLGRRPGLDRPLPKAAALAEAKRWLRGLAADNASKLTAELTDGVARAKGQPALTLAAPDGEPGAAGTDPGGRPFAHPRYWAAFVLIGDPD